MNELIGKRVDLLIFEKGFSSCNKFAEYIKFKYPQCDISSDTISNVINGKNITINTLTYIAKGLGVTVDSLITEKMSLADEYLTNEVETVKGTKLKERNKQVGEINNLECYCSLHDVGMRMYPSDLGDIYSEFDFKITTLAEWSIYFPLCDMGNVMNVIGRISGATESYEWYMLQQYKWLYETIPDSLAKDFADCQVGLMRLNNKARLTEKEEKLLLKLQQFAESDRYFQGYEQYKAIIKGKTI